MTHMSYLNRIQIASLSWKLQKQCFLFRVNRTTVGWDLTVQSDQSHQISIVACTNALSFLYKHVINALDSCVTFYPINSKHMFCLFWPNLIILISSTVYHFYCHLLCHPKHTLRVYHTTVRKWSCELNTNSIDTFKKIQDMFQGDTGIHEL